MKKNFLLSIILFAIILSMLRIKLMQIGIRKTNKIK